MIENYIIQKLEHLERLIADASKYQKWISIKKAKEQFRAKMWKEDVDLFCKVVD